MEEKREGLRWEPLISLFKSLLLLHPEQRTQGTRLQPKQPDLIKTNTVCFDVFWPFCC